MRRTAPRISGVKSGAALWKWTEAAGNGILTVLGALGALCAIGSLVGLAVEANTAGVGTGLASGIVGAAGKPGRARLASGPRVWKPVPKCRQRPRHPYQQRHPYGPDPKKGRRSVHGRLTYVGGIEEEQEELQVARGGGPGNGSASGLG